MGRNAPRLFYFLKIYAGLFVTVEKALDAPLLWKKHYSTGNMYVKEIKDNYRIIILENFDLDPLFCRYLEGYLQGFGDLTKSKNVVVKETKCTFRGAPYHEFLITWED